MATGDTRVQAPVRLVDKVLGWIHGALRIATLVVWALAVGRVTDVMLRPAPAMRSEPCTSAPARTAGAHFPATPFVATPAPSSATGRCGDSSPPRTAR